ncbi:MAG: Rrf2 family transcriptional regulator [Thermoguttaceae bacterium]|jgi:Rrf2 family cysteine metabolism transcriptional repressor|nr:Rrf2 family transcriptional regulator [Thermoguttaceae bacterium]
MKVFHKDADYAVRALLFLALQENDDFISATRMAKELGLPLNFLRRICSTLIKAKILEAREGASGGVRLLREPTTVNVLEIMELFHDDLELSDCTFRKALCPNRKTCVLRRRILGIEESVKREFQAITIQNLIDDITGQK